DPVLLRARRDALGAARQPQRRRELRGAAEIDEEEADRVFPHVLRRHSTRRVGLGAALRPGLLRRRQGGLRERLPLRSRGRADVHPRGDTLGRGPEAVRRRQAQDLLRQRAQAAEDARAEGRDEDQEEEEEIEKGPNGPFFVAGLDYL